MAVIYPSVEDIKSAKVAPTDGEQRLLWFLYENLDDSYEIFFQPFINGDNPDIVVMRKGAGVIIFEVKDWLLENYRIDDKTRWRVKNNDSVVKSPLSQVLEYKENLYDLHIENLLEKKIFDHRYFSIVNCAVYFHNEREDRLRNFLLNGFKGHDYERYRRFVSYFHLLGCDSLHRQRLRELLEKAHMNRPSVLFTDELYHSFKRHLKPSVHKAEQGQPINLTRAQQELSVSRAATRQKIKGVAGSGKSLVLAYRAVSAHKRTGEQVLILTFNLTLKNYIHDLVSRVREEFGWQNFYITNYHEFFRTQANNHGLLILSWSDYDDPRFFEPVQHKTRKYSAIFIDEIQDYKTEWIETITRYFLAPSGEFVVFADEKQNIYDRPVDESKRPIIRTIPGRWNELNEPVRFRSEITELVKHFQQSFFEQKYDLDTFAETQLQIDFGETRTEYYWFPDCSIEKIYSAFRRIVEKYEIPPSDTAILAARVEVLRELDFLIRHKANERTTTTFETREEYEKLLSRRYYDCSRFKIEIEKVRRNRKNHFWMNTGTVKLSTIHSFKGWEIHTLFLVIENEDPTQKAFATDELIYTGLTRARNNLFIFNLGNSRYDNFFRQHVSPCYEVP